MTCLIFLSTLSLRRATGIPVIFLGDNAISIHALLAESDWICTATFPVRVYFYPRSPCGERHSDPVTDKAWALISIHALLAESDAPGIIFIIFDCKFLSTLSLRRATAGPDCQGAGPCISIHALLAESDARQFRKFPWAGDFYPRSPCGERPRQFRKFPWAGDFYPRSPCGERRASSARHRAEPHFYPRSPCGERRDIDLTEFNRAVFLSTLSLRRATTPNLYTTKCTDISIHALLAESDRRGVCKTIHPLIFLSTLSLRRATSR